MDAWLVHEGSIRFYALIGSFGLVAIWEACAPRRTQAIAGRRWVINAGLTIATSILVGLAYPVLAVGVAFAAERAGVGLLRQFALPDRVEFAVAFVAIDLGRYAQHVLLHHAPWLWRLHRVHHSDVEYDCTTAYRFHPLEGFAVTLPLQLAVVVVIGASPGCVLVYEVVVVGFAAFAHANLRLPARLESVLRRCIVTPDVHRVHHSAQPAESMHNFGAIVPWWDMLFRTYMAEPGMPHETMPIGLADVRDERIFSLRWLLLSPFHATPSAPASEPA